MAVLIGTLLAQTLSGWALLGYPAAAFREGLGALRWLTASVMIYVGWIVITPRLYHVGRPRRWITPADFVASRFGRGALHCLLTCTTLVPTVLYVLIQFKGIAYSISAMSGGAVPPQAGAVLGAAVMLFYDFLGGMRSVAWLDCVQAVLMLTSFFVLLGMSIRLFGAVPHVMGALQRASPEHTATPDASGLLQHWSTSVLMLSFAIYPHQVSRTFAATSGRGLRGAGTAMALHPFLTQGLCLLVGWVATPALLGELDGARSDDLLFAVIARLMAAGAGGYWCAVLLMCALVAAMMSTADSGLMAIAALLSNDLVASYAPWPLGVRAQLRVAKGATAGACALIVLITTVEIDLVHLAALQQQILSQALPTVWLGLHAPSVRAPPLLSGLVVGLATTIAILAAGLARGGGFGYLWCGIHPGCWGLVANALTVAVHRAVVRCTARAPTPRACQHSPDGATSDGGGRGRSAARGAGADGDVHAELFGGISPASRGAAMRPPPPPEPARQWWFGAAVLALGAASAPFWRAAGEQDAVALLLPRWGDVSILINLALGLLVACAIRLGWRLERSSAEAAEEPRSRLTTPVTHTAPSACRRGKPRPAASYSYWWSRAPPMPPEVSLSAIASCSSTTDTIAPASAAAASRTAAVEEGAVVVDAIG